MTPEQNRLGRRTPDARRTKQDLVAGRIVRPHGVRGAVVFEPATDLVDRIRPGTSVSLGEAGKPARVRSLQAHGRRFLLELEGTTDRAQAESLRGLDVRVPLEAVGPLPDGVYFRWQIVGLRVTEEDGKTIGEVSEVLETGANDVYEVRRPTGESLLLPAIRSVVREIDLEAGVMRVVVPEGLADDG